MPRAPLLEDPYKDDILMIDESPTAKVANTTATQPSEKNENEQHNNDTAMLGTD